MDDLYFDPRPDLTDDSQTWHELLMAARAIDGPDPNGLFGALDGMRCLGCRIAIINGRAKLFRGDIAEGEYQELRERWLKPHHEKLVRLLENLEHWAA